MAENENMHGIDTSEKRGKRQIKSSSKHVWTAQKDACLIECLVRLAECRQWKADNGQFRAGYLTQLEKWMHEKLHDYNIKGSPHIESRVKLWKRQYHAIQEMLGPNASGFGWNDNDKCITCDAAVFNDWVKSHPGAAGLRNKPFPFLEELSQVFGKDRATGEGAEAPGDAVEEIEREEHMALIELPVGATFYDFEFDTNTMDREENSSAPRSPTHAYNVDGNNNNTAADTSQPGSSHAPPKKSKRRRSFNQDGDEFTNAIGSIKTMVEASGEHIARLANCFQFLADDAEARKKVFAELVKIEGLSQGERIRAGGLIAADSTKVSYFFSLPNECKKEYVDWFLGGCM